MVQWWLRRAAFLLAACVLAGLVGGWFLPSSYQIVMDLAYAQILLAVVVAIREGIALYGLSKPHAATETDRPET